MNSSSYLVRLENVSTLEAKLEKLIKKIQRKGLVAPVLVWGGVEVRKSGSKEYSVKNLTIENVIPKLSGWTFLAALTDVGGSNMVRTVPGHECPSEYFSRVGACDHCKKARTRYETYVLRNEEGTTLQVGNSCLKDFLGHNEANNWASYAEHLAEVKEMAEESEGGGWGRESTPVLSQFLPFVAAEIRQNGWISRAAVYAGTADVSTVDMTLTGMRKGTLLVLPEDEETAKNAQEWARNIPDEDANSSSYLHNLKTIARVNISDPVGIAASMIAAYERAMGRERARQARASQSPSNHVGEVGVRYAFGVKGTKKNPELTGALTLTWVHHSDGMYGTTTIAKFKDENDNVFKWFASGVPFALADVGKVYTGKASLKGHDEWKGEKETVLSRCSFEEREVTDA